MSNYTLAFQTGIFFGLVFSILFSSLLLVMVKINPEMMLNDYPPDIKAQYGPASEKTKQQRKPYVLLFLLILLGVPILSILRLDQMIAGVPSFLEVFVNIFTLFLVFNIVDLLILDWLIFCAITPRFIVLPGTEGMAGYKDYGFHFRGFLIGITVCLVSGLVFAGIATLVYFILGLL